MTDAKDFSHKSDHLGEIMILTVADADGRIIRLDYSAQWQDPKTGKIAKTAIVGDLITGDPDLDIDIQDKIILEDLMIRLRYQLGKRIPPF